MADDDLKRLDVEAVALRLCEDFGLVLVEVFDLGLNALDALDEGADLILRYAVGGDGWLLGHSRASLADGGGDALGVAIPLGPATGDVQLWVDAFALRQLRAPLALGEDGAQLVGSDLRLIVHLTRPHLEPQATGMERLIGDLGSRLR